MSKKDGIHFEYKKIKCPICGEKFHPVPEHAWMIGFGKNGYGGKKVCSYTCMRKWEKENHIKRRGDER